MTGYQKRESFSFKEGEFSTFPLDVTTSRVCSYLVWILLVLGAMTHYFGGVDKVTNPVKKVAFERTAVSRGN